MLSYVGLDYRFDFEPLIDDVFKKKFVFIGFSAWLLLIPLAITSSDKMVRLLLVVIMIVRMVSIIMVLFVSLI